MLNLFLIRARNGVKSESSSVLMAESNFEADVLKVHQGHVPSDDRQNSVMDQMPV